MYWTKDFFSILNSQQMAAKTLYCHLLYVVFSATTTGLLYNKNNLAPLCEFLRCSFVIFCSKDGLQSAVSNMLTLAASIGFLEEQSSVTVNLFLLKLLRLLYFASALLWGNALLKDYPWHQTPNQVGLKTGAQFQKSDKKIK